MSVDHGVLSKLKSREFRATSLSSYVFSTLYNTLPFIHVIGVIERTFDNTFLVTTRRLFHFYRP